MMNSLLFAPRYAARYPDDVFASLDRIFGDVTTQPLLKGVRLDVREDDKSYNITAELPGVTEKDVELTFDEGVLTITGEKKLERDETKDKWHITERSTGSFKRQLALSKPIDATKIEARFEKGVLNITLPKQPEPEPKAHKIEVKAS